MLSMKYFTGFEIKFSVEGVFYIATAPVTRHWKYPMQCWQKSTISGNTGKLQVGQSKGIIQSYVWIGFIINNKGSDALAYIVNPTQRAHVSSLVFYAIWYLYKFHQSPVSLYGRWHNFSTTFVQKTKADGWRDAVNEFCKIFVPYLWTTA